MWVTWENPGISQAGEAEPPKDMSNGLLANMVLEAAMMVLVNMVMMSMMVGVLVMVRLVMVCMHQWPALSLAARVGS